MGDDRSHPSSLRGRLADVFVPALVDGTVAALAQRLGNRATIDDPRRGRARGSVAIDSLLADLGAWLRGHGSVYRPLSSTSGASRDVAEGVLETSGETLPRSMPVAVVAERRRLREVELRLYYAADGTKDPLRQPLPKAPSKIALPQLAAHVLDALSKGAVERVLAAFEDASKIMDPQGGAHAKRDGRMASLLSELGLRVELDVTATTDDGRTLAIEANMLRPFQGPDLVPAVFVFERGDTGLFRELRIYF